MRRKTDRDILKENTWLICASCALIVLGILIGLGRKVNPLRSGTVAVPAAENFPCIFAGIILY